MKDLDSIAQLGHPRIALGDHKAVEVRGFGVAVVSKDVVDGLIEFGFAVPPRTPEDVQTYVESCYAFASTGLAAELHRQHGYRVRFNDNPKYPQILEIVEEVPLLKRSALPDLP
jgi:hypothetical protein